MALRDRGVEIKTPAQIEAMRTAGLVVGRTLELLRTSVRPGVTTGELDEAAEKFIRSQGGIPTFKGFRGFPGSICASPNSMVVHGIPGPYELKLGDIISIDISTDGSPTPPAPSRWGRSTKRPSACWT